MFGAVAGRKLAMGNCDELARRSQVMVARRPRPCYVVRIPGSRRRNADAESPMPKARHLASLVKLNSKFTLRVAGQERANRLLWS
jgi:hypothetical protein